MDAKFLYTVGHAKNCQSCTKGLWKYHSALSASPLY